MFNTLVQRLQELICPVHARQLAIQHGWQKRQGKISAFQFLYSAVGQASALELTLAAQARTLSQPATRQALDQRYNPAAVGFFRAAFEDALARSLTWQTDSAMTTALQKHFRAIRIFDSTQLPCSEALAELFPGCGGGGSPSAIKVLLSYVYGASQLQLLEILPGKRSDQGLSSRACQEVGPGELGLFDKGFYKASSLAEIGKRGGYFLLPWPHGVQVRGLDAHGQRTLLDVAGHLRASTQAREQWSAVDLGQVPASRLSGVRLLAYRLPQASADRRRAQLREHCRTHGRQPSAQALELAGWLILLTNAPADLLPSTAASYLFRVRWQVELVFKQWKSVLRLQVLKSRNASRVQCELWARLLCALLTFVWHQHANAHCLEHHQSEISFLKLAKHLQQHGQTLARTLFSARERLQVEYRHLWKTILTLARKETQPSRPTTWENLCSHWLEVPTT